jgi:hypothetical protein
MVLSPLTVTLLVKRIWRDLIVNGGLMRSLRSSVPQPVHPWMYVSRRSS